MASCCSDFPEYVVFDEIVPRLPIASLFRLRYVSKSWLSIIRIIILENFFPSEVDLSEMIVQVVNKTLHDSGWLALSFWKHFFSLSYDNLDLRFSLTPESDNPLDAESLKAHSRFNLFLGSVNGIIVFQWESAIASGCHMWNPATNSYKWTGPCITPVPDPNDDDPLAFMCEPDDAYFGCGFCAQSEDIKIVSIRSFIYWLYPINVEGSESDENEEFSDANDVFMDEDNLDGIKDFLDASDDFVDSVSDSEGDDAVSKRIDPVRDLNLQPDYIVEVYSLSTDSWRQVDIDPQLFLQFPPRTSTFYPQQGYTNTTFSWLFITRGIRDPPILKLLTFHMITEVFQVTSAPDAILCDSTYYSIYNSELPFDPGRVPFQLVNGTIALTIPTHDKSSFDIWLLLEYGVMDSWTRLCTVGPFPEVRQILGFWKNGKLFLESTSGELLLADLISNKIIQNFHIEGLPGFSQIIPHKQTHFLLK